MTSEAAPERLDRRLEDVVKAVGDGYCRLQMPLKLAVGVRETVAGRRLGALGGGQQVSIQHSYPAAGGAASTTLVCQLPANAETTRTGTAAAAAVRTHWHDATCEGTNG